jgi:hypothetical protein
MPKFSDKYVCCFRYYNDYDKLQFICNHCTKKYNKITYHAVSTINNMNGRENMLCERFGGFNSFERGHRRHELYNTYKFYEGKTTYNDYIKYGDIEDKIPVNSLTKYKIKKILQNNPCYNTTREYIEHAPRCHYIYILRQHSYYNENGEIMFYLFTLKDLYQHEEQMELIKCGIRDHFKRRMMEKRAMKIMKFILCC